MPSGSINSLNKKFLNIGYTATQRRKAGSQAQVQLQIVLLSNIVWRKCSDPCFVFFQPLHHAFVRLALFQIRRELTMQFCID